jgi:hypothetical protein
MTFLAQGRQSKIVSRTRKKKEEMRGHPLALRGDELGRTIEYACTY